MGTEELCLHSEAPPDFTASLLFLFLLETAGCSRGFSRRLNECGFQWTSCLGEDNVIFANSSEAPNATARSCL